MKEILLAFIITLFTTASQACCYRGYYHHGGYYGPGVGWVAPALVGGVIGYEIARPNTIVVEQQQPPVVYVQPQPVVQQPPVGYHWQQMIDPQTNTTKIVLVPN